MRFHEFQAIQQAAIEDGGRLKSDMHKDGKTIMYGLSYDRFGNHIYLEWERDGSRRYMWQGSTKATMSPVCKASKDDGRAEYLMAFMIHIGKGRKPDYEIAWAE